jgi:trimethylamine---corrinoid protein Co-methyltransferase
MTEPNATAGTASSAGPIPIAHMPARLALRILSDDDVRRAHAAAVELLGAEGAAASAATKSAPSTFVLAARAFGQDAVAGAGHCWLATGGPAARVRPREGGDPRPAVGADIDELCLIADALPEVGIVSAPPARAAGETALAGVARCLRGTSKHVLVTDLRTAAEADAAVEMAVAVARGEDIRHRPPLSLRAGADGLGAAVVFARAGLPVGVVAAPNGHADEAPVAAGEPADLARALVRHHAGVLAACAAVQATAPGAPFYYLADAVLAGLPATGPQASMFQIAATQLAAHVGLPVCAAGMLSGSHEPDWQACTQNAVASLSTTAAGADITAGAGTLGGGEVFSAQQLVMDAEIFSWNARIAGGIEVDEETIALEAIEQVGIGGNFLGQRHTRRHMKDVWRPRLLDRSMWDAWVASGREGAYEKATSLIERMLAQHQVAPLGDEVSGTLARIVAEAGL